MSTRGKGTVPPTPEPGDHQHTTPETDDPASPDTYILERVDEADPAAVSRVNTASVLGLESGPGEEIWAYRGHDRTGMLPPDAAHDIPQMRLSPQSFRAAVVSVSVDDPPTITVHVIHG
jgi:hypothetical protein